MNKTKPGCVFPITKGIRRGIPCGRPLNKKVKGTTYCKNHCTQLGILDDDHPLIIMGQTVNQHTTPVQEQEQETPLDVLANAAHIVISPSEEEILYEGNQEEVTKVMLQLFQNLRRNVNEGHIK